MDFKQILTDNGWTFQKTCCGGSKHHYDNPSKPKTTIQILPNSQYFYVFKDNHCIKAEYFAKLEETLTKL